MNIFYSHPDPRVAALNLDDKRVAKMALESAQILQGALLLLADIEGQAFSEADAPPYKVSKSQRNHPCMKWAASSRANYAWVLRHFEALSFEYMVRYPSSLFLQTYLKCYEYCKRQATLIPSGPFFAPDPLMDAAFQVLSIPTTGKYKVCLAYKYLYTDKRSVTFGNRPVPKFLSNERLLNYLHREYGVPVREAATIDRH